MHFAEIQIKLLFYFNFFAFLFLLFDFHHFNLLKIDFLIIKFRKVIHYYFIYIDNRFIRFPLNVDLLFHLNFLNRNNLIILAISCSQFSCSFKFRLWICFTYFIKLTIFCISNKALDFGKPFIF